MLKRIVVGVALFAFLLSAGVFTYSAVTQVSGLAIAQTASAWINLKDFSVGDNILSGSAMNTPCLYNGTGCDPQRGTIANGARVDVTRLGGTGADNSTNSTAKLPVLPCTAALNFPTWTDTNQVPCSAMITGAMRIAGPAIEHANIFNSRAASVANTQITVTIAAAANQRGHLYTVKAACTPAGTSFVTVQDGATLIAGTNAGQVPTAPAEYTASWPTGLTGSVNTNLVISLAACGAGNQGTLEVEADRF